MLRVCFLLLVFISSAWSHGPCRYTKQEWNCKSYQDDNSVYNRKAWKHWIDEDKDRQDTRQEVLIHESLIPVTFNEKGKVVAGKWKCFFTGNIYTDPKLLDIDHFIPLKEAHRSWGSAWPSETKMFYANDMFLDENSLIAVYRSANRSKSDRDPSKWLPAVNKCEYVKIWAGLKNSWGLTMNSQEAKFIEDYLNECKKSK